MSTVEPPQQIAVVIATSNRLCMLEKRSLPSVKAQTRSPDFLLVVDDSVHEARPANASLVGSQALRDCEVRYLENERTEGASGAWNTALDFLVGEVDDPSRVFVAVLDDDDCWLPEYLDSCITMSRDQQLDMVATDLRRFESVDGQPLLCKAPDELHAADFLTGNPGIQGSNLFVRLSLLLAAGGFDEALRSTTDRDLCIRIADVGGVRYGRLPTALVDHFAEAGRSRLSSRGSQDKVDGLAAFWRKYVGRMTNAQRQAFSDRTASLFDWRPLGDGESFLPRADTPRKALILGLIADNDRPKGLLKVLRELAGWRDDTLVGLDLVLLERGRRCGEQDLINETATLLRNAGAGCFRFSLELQNDNLISKLLPRITLNSDRTAAESSHELLRVYCARVAATRIGTEVWFAERTVCNELPPRRTQAMDILRWLRASRVDNEQLMTPHSDPAAISALDRWIQRERVATAAHRVRRRFSLDHIRLLGWGSEAVVFTDESTVYKCIDYWKTRMPQSQMEFLKGQVGRWAHTPGLYAIQNVVEGKSWAVLTYDYEASCPYKGGQKADLISLLNGCRDVNVICNNVHPKNLIVTQTGVKLIDYGSDIRPWSALGFEHMARRAFLTYRHAAHPNLKSLMRQVLTDIRLPEMAGYSDFRAQLDAASNRLEHQHAVPDTFSKVSAHPPLRLYVGVITSDPSMLKPLLDGLVSLAASAAIEKLAVLVLDNGSPPGETSAVLQGARDVGLDVAIIDEARQGLDAAAGGFGSALRNRPQGQVGIAMARTMLQRYLGSVLAADTGSFGWVLDDDMRVDARAHAYLRWLPAFREQGVDALIGAYEGASPNPPLNGLRVQLVDLLHNLHWLRSLPDDMVLPDRTAENALLRTRYPDYYYDLSRKHTGHLEMPHWLEPAVPGETVRETYSRLLNGAVGLLNGNPLTRPVIATQYSDPLVSAKDSVNRGGCTFILNHRALSETPNTITAVRGREARRSDMVWAIVNRHYRRMTIKAVAFPVHHIGRVNTTPSLNLEKVQGEIIGSTLYAGLTEFLRTRPHHELDFSTKELDEVCRLADLHLTRRWHMLEQSFHRIAGLRQATQSLVRSEELLDLVGYLDQWFTPDGFDRLRSGVRTHDRGNIRGFLSSLRAVADDYALTTVNINFIQAQLWTSGAAMTGEFQE